MSKKQSNSPTPFPYDSPADRASGQTFIFWLLIAGLSMIFLALLSGVVYHWFDNQFPAIHVPIVFYGNVIILLSTEYLIERVWSRVKSQQFTNRILTYLWLALIGGILFLIGQSAGWYYMIVYLDITAGTASGAFIYSLSGIHFIHVLIVLPIQILFTIDIQNNSSSLPNYLNRPDRQNKLMLLRNYWHVLSVIWMLLFTVLILMQLIGKNQ